MIKYNLICSKCTFTFNSWFSTSSEFDRLKKKKMISCTGCGSDKISKSIMSPSVPRNQQIDKNKVKIKKEIRKKILEYQKFIKDNSTYVGEDFAYEARSLHYDKKKTKSIYGKATKEEIEDLNEEGIETTTIPWIKDYEN
tara:strand:- start:299 stop:718 length:420 start_codon:yes stop_codon:yes gene_type:complete